MPRTTSEADVANMCRMMLPDLECLRDVYAPPTLCLRRPTPADFGGYANGTAWGLWIKNK